MLRDYETGKSTNVSFFIGTEVENTKAKGFRTLFVAGLQPTSKILDIALKNEVKHIYLGANHSFVPNLDWNYNTVNKCIVTGYLVSLNYPINYHNNVINELNDLYTHEMFIPQISLQFPDVEHENPNLNIKIDDIDFEATNNGVWCFNLSDVCTDDNKTTWDKYKSDKIL